MNLEGKILMPNISDQALDAILSKTQPEIEDLLACSDEGLLKKLNDNK